VTPAEQVIQVLVADDDRLVRAGIRLILAPVPGIEIIAEAGNGVEATDLTIRHRPQVVLLDIQMPVLDGLGALRQIRAASATSVIMLTTFGEAHNVEEALADGAAGFLLKDSAAEELVPAIRAASAGEAFLSPPVTRQALTHLQALRSAPRPTVTPRLAALSEREREVLILLAQGLSNTAISERLWITESTVKSHVSHILVKLDCDNRVQAALLAHQAGLLGT
jgi:DNA-binding NarL/FixJ family response regulator